MSRGKDKARDDVTKKVGVAQDVLGLLERYSIEREVNGRFGIEA